MMRRARLKMTPNLGNNRKKAKEESKEMAAHAAPPPKLEEPPRKVEVISSQPASHSLDSKDVPSSLSPNLSGEVEKENRVITTSEAESILSSCIEAEPLDSSSIAESSQNSVASSVTISVPVVNVDPPPRVYVAVKTKFRPNLTEVRRKRTISGTSNDGTYSRVRTISGSSDGGRRVRTISTGSNSGDIMQEVTIQTANNIIEEPSLASPMMSPRSPTKSISSEIGFSTGNRRVRRLTESSNATYVEDATVFDKRKADHKRKFLNGVPSRSKMTIFDFIYHNPSDGSRMASTASNASSRRNSRNSSCSSSVNGEETTSPVKDREQEVPDVSNLPPPKEVAEEEEDEKMPVPQVKIGPDGQIILDEESTFIETSAAKKAKEELLKTPLVFETQSSTNYGTWGKKRKTVDWSEKETLRFYSALSIFGTDFSMMSSIFKKRNRHDLKMKFKKEERVNRNLVDKCLRQRDAQFDLSTIASESDTEPEENVDDPAEMKKRRLSSTSSAKSKKPRKKRRKGVRRSRGYTDSTDDEREEEEENDPKKGPHPPGPQPMLKSLLTQPPRSSIKLVNDVAPAAQPLSFPPGLLEANPELANATQGSIVIVASHEPSTTRKRTLSETSSTSGRSRTMSGSGSIHSFSPRKKK